MARKKKVKDLCFCLIPAIAGVIIILLNILIIFNEESGILYHNFAWAFLWVFLGFSLISHTIISFIEVCKRE